MNGKHMKPKQQRRSAPLSVVGPSIPGLSLPGVVLLPGGLVRCHLSNSTALAIHSHLFAHPKSDHPGSIPLADVVLLSNGGGNRVHNSNDIIGTAARVLEIIRPAPGKELWGLVLQGFCRVAVDSSSLDCRKSDSNEKSVLKKLTCVRQLDYFDPPLDNQTANPRDVDTGLGNDAASQSPANVELHRSLVQQVGRLMTMGQNEESLTVRRLLQALERAGPALASDLIGGLVAQSLEDRHALLTTVNVEERLLLVDELLKKAIAVRNSVSHGRLLAEGNPLTDSVDSNEAGNDAVNDPVTVVLQRLKSASPPQEVWNAAQRERHKLQRTSRQHPEFSSSLAYLEVLADLPWQRYSSSTPTLSQVRALLDTEHFGLDKVKERIVQYVAVQSLRNWNAKAPVLCLVGPPGVGKTTVARSLATALGRPFQRISLGGCRDEAEIRGHRRTYVNSMPGRVISALRRAGTKDAVILLDEVDKTGRDARGDPAAALLEVLDPEQNAAFVDTYLALPFDLSKVFFIATANVAAEIPPALFDRLEVVNLGGYTVEEKVAIAQNHLVPKAVKEHGLQVSDCQLEEDDVRSLIQGYTREAGVRQLARCIDALCRYVAVQVVTERQQEKEDREKTETEKDVKMNQAMIQVILGPPRYSRATEASRSVTSPGLATGLVWTAVGGGVMHVECLAVGAGETGRPGKLTLTGRLGEVLEESARVALSWVRANVQAEGEEGAEGEAAMKWDVHIHFPEGAVPKDGPSAGITLAIALVSLFTGRCVREDTAATGELTLRGLVLPVGGIKEKVAAAVNAGYRRVIMPAVNVKEALAEMPELSKRIELVAVEKMEDALKAAFFSSRL